MIGENYSNILFNINNAKNLLKSKIFFNLSMSIDVVYYINY